MTSARAMRRGRARHWLARAKAFPLWTVGRSGIPDATQLMQGVGAERNLASPHGVFHVSDAPARL